MKALEMLKEGEIALLKGIEIFGNNDSDILKLLKEVREAIAELEAQEIMITDYKKRIAELEAPKSCDGCRFDSERQFGCYRFDDCCREHTRKERIDRYEPKDK